MIRILRIVHLLGKIKYKFNLLKHSVSVLSFIILSAFLLYAFSFKATGETNFSPPKQHPRLLINSAEIDRVKNLIHTLPNLKEKILQDAENPIIVSEILNDNSINKLKLEESRKNFEANALLYILCIDPKTGLGSSENPHNTGRKAINLSLKTLQVMNKVDSYEQYTDSQACGQTLFGAAMVYDWCYDLLSDDEKNNYIKCFETLSKKMELGYPPKSWGSINGHSCEMPLAVHLLSVGIAIYDEKPDMYNLLSNWFFNEFVPARNFWYPSGMQHQGDSYGLEQSESTMLSTWIFARMGYKDVISDDQKYIPYRWIYTRRPDGQLMRDGDCFKCDQYALGQYWRFPMPLLLLSSYYKDPYIQSELSRHYYAGITGKPVLELLFYDPSLTEKPINKLPLTRFFGYPMGSMTARTGWDEGVNFDSSTVVAEMKVGVYQFNGHQHLDSGQFQIYYKGALAIDSGIYNGTSSDKEHDINYHKRTIAHNCLLVYDKNEEFYLYGKQRENDGGQRWPNYGNLPQTLNELLEKDYKTGSVLSNYAGPDSSAPDFSYLEGDLADAYSSKVKDYKRAFVFMNLKNLEHPAALVVYDKVTSSDKNFKKTWLLHSIEPPVIKDNVTTIIRSTSVDNSNKYNGKLVNYTLTPDLDDLNIKKTGGSGKEFYSSEGNYPNTPFYENNSVEAGAWRIEISPKTYKESDRFLNVIQVQDYRGKNGALTTPLNVKKIDNDYVEGAMIYDRIVLFSKNSDKLCSNFSLCVPEAEVKTELLKFFITNLSEGTWTINGTGKNKLSKTINVSEDGVLLFEGSSGDYTLYYNLKSETPATKSTTKPTPKTTTTPTIKPTTKTIPKTTPKPIPKPTVTPTPKSTTASTVIYKSTPTPLPVSTYTPISTLMPEKTDDKTNRPEPRYGGIPAYTTTTAPSYSTTPTSTVTPPPTAVIPTATAPAIATVRTAPSPTITTSNPNSRSSAENFSDNLLSKAHFSDVPESFWGFSSISALAKQGVIYGKAPGVFKPNDYVTRAEFVTMITRALLLSEPEPALCFSDVGQKDWYYNSVTSAYIEGLINGRPDGSFGPNDNIIRQDVGVILCRILSKYYNCNPVALENIDNFIDFSDSSEVSNYAASQVATVIKYDLMKGKPGNILDPKGKTTRAECAAVIHKLINSTFPLIVF